MTDRRQSVQYGNLAREVGTDGLGKQGDVSTHRWSEGREEASRAGEVLSAKAQTNDLL